MIEFTHAFLPLSLPSCLISNHQSFFSLREIRYVPCRSACHPKAGDIREIPTPSWHHPSGISWCSLDLKTHYNWGLWDCFDKMTDKIRTWHAKYLSYVARLQLVNIFLMSILYCSYHYQYKKCILPNLIPYSCIFQWPNIIECINLYILSYLYFSSYIWLLGHLFPSFITPIPHRSLWS